MAGGLVQVSQSVGNKVEFFINSESGFLFKKLLFLHNDYPNGGIGGGHIPHSFPSPENLKPLALSYPLDARAERLPRVTCE